MKKALFLGSIISTCVIGGGVVGYTEYVKKQITLSSDAFYLDKVPKSCNFRH